MRHPLRTDDNLIDGLVFAIHGCKLKQRTMDFSRQQIILYHQRHECRIKLPFRGSRMHGTRSAPGNPQCIGGFEVLATLCFKIIVCKWTSLRTDLDPALESLTIRRFTHQYYIHSSWELQASHVRWLFVQSFPKYLALACNNMFIAILLTVAAIVAPTNSLPTSSGGVLGILDPENHTDKTQSLRTSEFRPIKLHRSIRPLSGSQIRIIL